jgi:hypothetical protein
MHSHLLAVLPYLLYGQALLCCPDSPCSMHSHLLAVLPYLLYGQALLCCPYSPAQCTAACLLFCLIFFIDRLIYAVLTHLLIAQLLAGCPALSSLWTGSSTICCPDSPAQCTAACSLSYLIFFMDRLFYANLTHLLTAQLVFSLCCSLSGLSSCYPASSACFPDSPVAIMPLLLTV